MKTRIPKQRAPEESCAMGGHKLNYYVVLRSLGASVSRLMKLFLPPPSSSINHTHPSFLPVACRHASLQLALSPRKPEMLTVLRIYGYDTEYSAHAKVISLS